jgi:hypothetical protein
MINMKRTTLSAMLVAVGILQSGCGGGSGGVPTCSAFTACGGDLTGQWAIDGVCTEGDFAAARMGGTDLPEECKNAVQSVSVQMSGTLTYASGIETSDIRMTMKVKYTFTAACISAMAGGVSVPMTQEVCSAAGSVGGGDPEAPTISCNLAGNACNCNMTIDTQGTGTDSYTVSGSIMTYTDGDSAQFCVSGDKLTLRQASDGEMPGMQVKAHRK